MAAKGKNSAVYSGTKFVKLTAGVGTITGGPVRALWVGTAGTATFIDLDGNVCTNFPLIAGPNAIQIQELTSLGTASDVWGVW